MKFASYQQYSSSHAVRLATPRITSQHIRHCSFTTEDTEITEKSSKMNQERRKQKRAGPHSSLVICHSSLFFLPIRNRTDSPWRAVQPRRQLSSLFERKLFDCSLDFGQTHVADFTTARASPAIRRTVAIPKCARR